MPKRPTYLLSLALLVAGCASAPFSPSPHYDAVAKHLDVGGQVLLFADVDGDLAAGADYLDKLLVRLRATYPDLKLDRINARRILSLLGLEQVQAVGLSSARDGKAFHNRAFLAYGKDRRGLLLMTGAPPHALEVAAHAPADADLVFESDLKIKSLLDLVESIAVEVAGKEGADLFKGLDEKLPGTALTVRQVIGHLDTRLIGVLRVDEQRAFKWPGEDKISVPGIDFLLAADDLVVLFDAYQPVLSLLPNVKSGEAGDLRFLEFEIAVPGAPWLRPVLAKHTKTGRVFIGTSRSFLGEYLEGKAGGKPVLAEAADWKRATARFEAKANGQSFMSGAFMPKLGRCLRQIGKDDKQVQAGLDLIQEFLPEAGVPFAAQQVSMADGLFYGSYATSSHKRTLFPALAAGPLVVVGALASVATSGLRKYLRAATASKPSAGAYPEPEREEDAGEEQAAPDGAPERFRIPLGGPSRGASQPTVSIVEFSDFECPFCGRVNPTLRKLLDRYPNDVRIYFRHNPLPFHLHAALAAQAAMAADAQGKFWPMHDKLFDNQRDLDRTNLETYAQAVGLDIAKFKAALDAETFKAAVDADAALAAKTGAAGTPNFFINGRQLTGAQPFDAFAKLVDEEIAGAKQLMAAGTKRADVYAKLMATASEPRPYRPEPPKPVELSDEVYKVPVGQAPGRGGSAPKVTLIEYADFQCPFCARVHATLGDLAKRYGDDIRLVYKHNPLSFHARAMPAALAAEAARGQGKFWALHDRMLAEQQNLTDADLERYAEDAGLNMARYRAALKNDRALRRRIEADQDEAARFGATGTPNFFVNGRPLRGAQPIETFAKLIDEEIAKADARLRKGTPRRKLYAVLTQNGLGRAKSHAEAGQPESQTVYRVDVAGAPVRGARDALVTLVMFSDYQCPFCRRVEPTLTKILGDYKGQVRVVWRDMPLPFHARAKDAAIAARAAGAQGKYWQMHDRLFGSDVEDGPMALEKADLERRAREVGLDMQAFAAAIADEQLGRAVEADIAVATKLGVRGTPAFFINGKFLSGAQPYETFKRKIDEELKSARKLVAKGTPKAKVYSAIMKAAKTEVVKAE